MFKTYFLSHFIAYLILMTNLRKYLCKCALIGLLLKIGVYFREIRPFEIFSVQKNVSCSSLLFSALDKNYIRRVHLIKPTAGTPSSLVLCWDKSRH